MHGIKILAREYSHQSPVIAELKLSGVLGL